MKTRSSIGAITFIALTISLNAADDATNERFAKERQSSYTERLGKVSKASQFIGAEVGTSQDERIGRIDDMAIDVETGRILEVYVSSGGILGLGQKTVAIPPGSPVAPKRQCILQISGPLDQVQLWKISPTVRWHKAR